MKSIIDLPADDIWSIIFSNLSIHDLLKCRLVNKQFKFFSDNTNGIQKLIVGQPNLIFDCNYWFYNKELIDDKDLTSLKCFRTINLLGIFNLDKNLKYLKVNDQQFELEELPNLINLESIEFGYGYGSCSQQTIVLNKLKFFSAYHLSVKLNTTELERIQFNDINRIELDSTASIKHLITDNYDNRLELFKNLETMELRNTCYVNENLLIIFKYLKELRISLSGIIKYSNQPIENSLIKIFDDRLKLKKEIDIYLEGVKIKHIDKLNELKTNEYPYWQFKINNYPLLHSDLSSINRLNYRNLKKSVISNLENSFSTSFFHKFKYINYVYVSVSNDLCQLIWFLNSLQNLTTLEIGSEVSLGELFYYNVPSTIKYLDIFNGKNINYEFVFTLFKLINFYTGVDKDLFDLAITSFSNLKYLKSFGFNFKSRRILIEKKCKNFYLNGKKLDYNELVEEFKLIRSN